MTGGVPASRGTGYFLPVTIVADVDRGVRLVDEERSDTARFIMRYTDVDSIVDKANDNPNGRAHEEIRASGAWSRSVNG
jgi:acyl-CoA reductase-like NAD-dependent aldehyde dehydrogenase